MIVNDARFYRDSLAQIMEIAQSAILCNKSPVIVLSEKPRWDKWNAHTLLAYAERGYYYISDRGTIHKEYCQHAYSAKGVSDLYTRLLERGLKPCKKCNPAKVHEDGVRLWTPQIATFVEESIGIYY